MLVCDVTSTTPLIVTLCLYFYRLLLKFIRVLYKTYVDLYFTYLEINPLGISI